MEKTSFQNPSDPSREIFVFHDVPHLLKLLQNHIIDEGINIFSTTGLIYKSDFQSVLNHDISEFKILHKIKDAHLHCSGPLRQNVRLASQLLSHTVAVAMKNLTPEKTDQSNFVSLINDWFDILNSRQKFSKTKLNCAFGVHFEEQLFVLNKMIKVSTNMRCNNRKTLVPFQRGIIISCKSLLNLFEELREKRGVKFLLTSHLNQDCLENFFSCVRGTGGTYTHPTTSECINRIRSLIVGRAPDIVLDTTSTAKHAR